MSIPGSPIRLGHFVTWRQAANLPGHPCRDRSTRAAHARRGRNVPRVAQPRPRQSRPPLSRSAYPETAHDPAGHASGIRRPATACAAPRQPLVFKWSHSRSDCSCVSVAVPAGFNSGVNAKAGTRPNLNPPVGSIHVTQPVRFVHDDQIPPGQHEFVRAFGRELVRTDHEFGTIEGSAHSPFFCRVVAFGFQDFSGQKNFSAISCVHCFRRLAGVTIRIRRFPSAHFCEMTSPASMVFPRPTSSASIAPLERGDRNAKSAASN